MANYQLLKADIDAKVYQNGAQEITGANLNSVLNEMVTTLGAEYQFAGVATIDTNPGTPDAKVFYIANGKGTYTNFGGLEVTEDDVVVLYWDSSWHKVSTGIASQEKLTELEQEVNGIEELDINGTYSAFEYIPIDAPIEAGRVIYNRSNYVVYVYSRNTELTQIDPQSSKVYDVDVTRFRASADAGNYIIHVDGAQSLQEQINAKVNDVVDNNLYGRKHGEWKVISLDDINMKDTHSIYGECVNIVRDVWVRENIGDIVEEAPNYHLFVYLLKANKHYIFTPSAINVPSNVQSIVYRFSIGANATPSAGDSIIMNQIKQLCSVNEVIDYTPVSDQYLWVQSYYGGICCDCYEYEDKNISIILKERTRKVVNILKTDTEVEIFEKMLNAYYTGNIDIVFEKGTYEFSSVYPYMYDRVKFTGHYEGLPIGNNCRYYFNGSTLISNAPSAEYSGLRNILDTCGEGSNFEVYDVTLINNGGHYCIHDEVTSSTNVYRHIYKNVIMKYVTTQGTKFGDKPFGCGTGFDGFISLENCFVLSDYTQDNTFAVHGATYNPSSNPQNLTIELKSCYFGAGMLELNTTYYDATRDNIVLVVSNCKLKQNMDDNTTALAKELYVWGNEVIEYQG